MSKLKHKESRNEKYRKTKDIQDRRKYVIHINIRRTGENEAKGIFEDKMTKNFPNEE